MITIKLVLLKCKTSFIVTKDSFGLVGKGLCYFLSMVLTLVFWLSAFLCRIYEEYLGQTDWQIGRLAGGLGYVYGLTLYQR
jgi:hypothetical protein